MLYCPQIPDEEHHPILREGVEAAVKATSRRDLYRRASWFQSGKEPHKHLLDLRILCEKYLQHQQNLYNAFIDFKTAFDRVSHEALWATMRKYNINANIILVIENLYDNVQSAIMLNGSTGYLFRTTVGVRQSCLL